jgi:LPXTG-motif cell wall-anchored protein
MAMGGLALLRLFKKCLGKGSMKKMIVAGVSFALLFAPVAPASANPTLPAGDVLYEMSCDGMINGFQLHLLNTSDNTRTAIGTATGAVQCASQGAILPGTDWFYFTDFADTLVRADVTSGLTEVIGDLRDAGVARDIDSLAMDDNGNAYALSGETLFSVDLSSGNLTSVAAANFATLTGGMPIGFAYDPTTDKFYVAEDGESNLYSINISTGALTFIATNSDYWVSSMSFDSDGNLWVNGGHSYVSRVAISDFGNSANWIDSAALSPNVYSESLAIARLASNDEENSDGSESLANTGSADAAPYLLGGLLAAGIALAFRRRRV